MLAECFFGEGRTETSMVQVNLQLNIFSKLSACVQVRFSFDLYHLDISYEGVDDMKSRLKNRIDLYLVFIVILAAFLNGYNIWTDQYANTYYTTAVASMLENFHNFFFGSLDSAGSVTVDKPPVVFWIQTISAAIFGLHGWSVILPQAIAGVGSVLLSYFLVKPTFGVKAARIAAIAMAATPIAVAVSRTNNIDSMLVFTLLIATWLLFRSVKRTSVWSLLGAFAVIGLAFNMKMLQAYMILPAFYIFYFIAAKVNWKKKLRLLSGATIIMIVISLSWAVIVDMIPEDQRPYIGSSETNSVLELAFGYNGMSRLTGQQGGVGGTPPTNQPNSKEGTETPANNQSMKSMNRMPVLPPGGFEGGEGPEKMMGAPGGGSSGGMFGTGEKGPLRLFQSELSGQASWLLPLVAFACVSLLAGARRKNITMKQKETIFWLAWLIPAMVFFSIAGFFHHYYLIMLAPPIAALFGAGWIQLYEDYKNHSGWKSWLLPIAVLVTAGFQWYIVHPYDAVIGAGWSITIAVVGIIAAAALILFKHREGRWRNIVHVLGFLVLFIGPLYWAATPITYGGNSMIPQAGPGAGSMFGGEFSANVPAGDGMNSTATKNDLQNSEKMSQGSKEGKGIDETTLSYLKENNTGETYLFATTSYQTAAPYMIDEGESVIIMGGFSGSDPVYTVEELEKLVKDRKVKYFLISDGGMRGGSSDVTEWIKENGTEIPSKEWKTTTNSDNETMRGPGGSDTLYKVEL